MTSRCLRRSTAGALPRAARITCRIIAISLTLAQTAHARGTEDDAGTDAAGASHPTITEVLFAVPRSDGDANGDGRRHSTGDEFVEIHNLTEESISLRGYTLTTRLSTGESDPSHGFHFTFPACTLAPGEFAVVFNGYDWRPTGPVGTRDRAAAEGHPDFHGAWVFNAASPSPNRAMSNSGDFILLTDPTGHPLEAVVWGSPDPAPPGATAHIERVSANPKGSVHRLEAAGPFDPHHRLSDDRCSPGREPKTNATEE